MLLFSFSVSGHPVWISVIRIRSHANKLDVDRSLALPVLKEVLRCLVGSCAVLKRLFEQDSSRVFGCTIFRRRQTHRHENQ